MGMSQIRQPQIWVPKTRFFFYRAQKISILDPKMAALNPHKKPPPRESEQKERKNKKRPYIVLKRRKHPMYAHFSGMYGHFFRGSFLPAYFL